MMKVPNVLEYPALSTYKGHADKVGKMHRIACFMVYGNII